MAEEFKRALPSSQLTARQGIICNLPPCNKSSLRNESDVEQFFILPILKILGYSDKNILTKHVIPSQRIGKGNKQRNHIPDYLLKVGRTPVVIVEAKHPEKNIDKFIQEAQEYASAVNRGYIGKNPVQYVLVSNGYKTKVARADEHPIVLKMNFEDFSSVNEKIINLNELISFDSMKKSIHGNTREELFEFRTPEISELKGVFTQAHNSIRRTEKIGPKKAFYEFTKLLFVKLNEDQKVQKKIDKNKSVTKGDFNFSVHKIKNTHEAWINSLFENYRTELETQVLSNKKKRIFQSSEKINLKPSTIKEIVQLIESFNLKKVEDDINGKVFETFLEASVRGKELGQFFTPRSVVRFMVEIADLTIKRDFLNREFRPDKVLDGSCGTGGFLIYALSNLFKKIPVSCSKINDLKRRIREESLYGIDASPDDIVPITRMNMYLHGDGGSHIYLADTLDKELVIESGTDGERTNELKELRNLIDNHKFDVVLTNPPFSMKYEQKKADEKRIIEQYEISRLSNKPVASLKSNLMFLERYHDLLKDDGKLLTVIDESVLNTEGQGKSMRRFRQWLRSKYIIRAIVSLPRNTFVNADAGVKTSVLYLTKRISLEQEQPPVFMAISEDVGHNDAGRVTSEWGDLENILKSFKKFQNGHY